MNYYELLEVRENASQEVIEMAYKALMRKYHPDVYRGDLEFAHTISQQINEAHEILSDPERRAQYDSSLNPGQQGAEKRPPEEKKRRGFTVRFGRPAHAIPIKPTIFLILCAILFILLLASAVHLHSLNAALEEQASIMEIDLEKTREMLNEEKKRSTELLSFSEQLSNDLIFYYSNACIVADRTRQYHHYGCSYIRSSSYRVLDVKNANHLGYSPCPYCWDKDFDDYYSQ